MKLLSGNSIFNANTREGERSKGGVFHVYDSLETIGKKLPGWRANLSNTSGGPFATWDWYLSWLEIFTDSYEEIVFLEVRLFSEGGEESTCVFPMIQRGKRLDLAGCDLGDFQDAMSDEPERMSEFVDVLIQFAGQRGLVVAFSKLSDVGVLKYELIRAAERVKAPLLIPHVGPCPYFSIEGNGIDDVLGRLGKSTRKGIRRRVRNFEKEFGKDFTLQKGLDPEFLEAAAKLHKKLQHFKPGESIFGETGMRRFLKQISKSDAVGVTCSLLRDKSGRAIAFDIGYQCEDTFYAWVAAYDPDLSEYRPGTCSMAWLIDALSKDGVKTFDFLCGAEKYKYQYASDEQQIHGVTIYPNRFLYRCYTRTWRVAEVLKAKVKAFAIRYGIYSPNYKVD